MFVTTYGTQLQSRLLILIFYVSIKQNGCNHRVKNTIIFLSSPYLLNYIEGLAA